MKPEPWATDAEFATSFVYEKNGVKQEFTAENYPWKDPSWKFVSSKSVEVKPATGQSEIHDFSLTDEDGEDITEDVMTAEGYVYIWFLREPAKAHLDNIEKIKALAKTAAERKIPFYVACSAGRDICETYQEAWNMKDVPFLIIDGTVSKTVMRTNPGLMLLRDGVVQNKWSYKDYPANIAQ
jgi:triosephosphate isomerase